MFTKSTIGLAGPNKKERIRRKCGRIEHEIQTQLSELEGEIQRLITQVQPTAVQLEDAVTAELTAPSAHAKAPATPVTSPLQVVVELWDTIPGIDELTASTMVAEGANMDQFPTARHAATLSVDILHRVWYLGPCDERPNCVSASRPPLVSQQLVVHAGKESVALAHLSTEQGHPLNGAGIDQIARVDVAERRALG